MRSSFAAKFSRPKTGADISSLEILGQPLFVPSGKEFGSEQYMGMPTASSFFLRLVVF